MQSLLALALGLGLLASFSLPCFAQGTAALESQLEKRPDDLKTRLTLANAYANENRPEKTIELLNPYTDQLDNNGFLLLASSYAKRQDFANEVRVLSFLMNKDEANYKWHMLLAQAYVKQASEVKDAERRKELLTAGIQRLRRVLQLQKKFKPAFDLLLNVFLEQRANNEARELLLEGVTKFGKRPELFRELCRLDSQDGFLVQAVNNCGDSISLTPTYPDHYVYLVQALHDQKEDQRAESQIVAAGKRFPQSEFVQWAAGELFLRKKNYPVAGRYFQAAARAKPDSARAQFGLAKARFESGDEAGALDPFIAACKLDSSTLETFLAATGRLKQKGSDLVGKYLKASNTCR